MWSDSQIKQFSHEIDWLRNKIKKGVTERQKKEYEHQIKRKELEIGFNNSNKTNHN